MNNLIHEEIKVILNATYTWIYFTENKWIFKSINPLLLDFLTSITNTIREQEISNTTEHIKKTRLYFILCQLICTNPKSLTPIHDLIADMIEVCRGSHKLIQILGCASSTDTHDRIVTQYSMDQCQVTIWDDIPSNVSSIASVDNLTCCRVTQLFTVVTNNGVIMEQL